MHKIYPLLTFCLAFFVGCFVMENQYAVLPPGIWRATLELEPQQAQLNRTKIPKAERSSVHFEEVADAELPFNFEIIYTNQTEFYIEIINGKERIKVDDISVFHNKATGRDSIIIRFPVFGTYIEAAFQDGIIEGNFYDPARSPDYSIPFRAKHGKDYRFTQLKKKPMFDISGKWQTTFAIDKDKPYDAIGEFEQSGNHLTGTFVTETGDYRFLEGTVQDNKMYLSCFDGVHAYLFEAKLQEDSTLIGSFRSGNHYKNLWEARKNPGFRLANADSLTFLKPGYESFDFTFENTDGKMVSIHEEQYRNKVKIIQVFGTWCPNCLDETNFLLSYLDEKKPEGLEIIALSFEKYKEKERAFNAIKTYKEKLGIPYAMLYAGSSNKKEAAEALPMLNHVLSFPTMIFIDRQNKVRKIHTGFAGPATSQYDDFTTDFDAFVTGLLNEEESF